MRNTHKYLALVILVLFVVIFPNLVRGQEIKNNYMAEVEPEILAALNSSEWVQVIVKLYSENDTLRDYVLTNLSSSEFELQEKLLRGDAFAGNITKEGLDKLANNPNVRIIYFNRVVYTLDNETKNESLNEKVDSEVYTNLDNFEWVRVIVDVDSKNSINSIVSQIPETEIKFKREMAFRNAFVAEITKPGLEVLINNSYVNKISWDKVAYTLNDRSQNKSSSETKGEVKKSEYQKINWLLIIILTFAVLLIIFYLIFHKRKLK